MDGQEWGVFKLFALENRPGLPVVILVVSPHSLPSVPLQH